MCSLPAHACLPALSPPPQAERARASRALHLAHCHLAGGRPAEAAALLLRAEERAAAAREDAKALGGPGAAAAVARMEGVARWAALFKWVDVEQGGCRCCCCCVGQGSVCVHLAGVCASAGLAGLSGRRCGYGIG